MRIFNYIHVKDINSESNDMITALTSDQAEGFCLVVDSSNNYAMKTFIKGSIKTIQLLVTDPNFDHDFHVMNIWTHWKIAEYKGDKLGFPLFNKSVTTDTIWKYDAAKTIYDSEIRAQQDKKRAAFLQLIALLNDYILRFTSIKDKDSFKWTALPKQQNDDIIVSTKLDTDSAKIFEKFFSDLIEDCHLIINVTPIVSSKTVYLDGGALDFYPQDKIIGSKGEQQYHAKYRHGREISRHPIKNVLEETMSCVKINVTKIMPLYDTLFNHIHDATIEKYINENNLKKALLLTATVAEKIPDSKGLYFSDLYNKCDNLGKVEELIIAAALCSTDDDPKVERINYIHNETADMIFNHIGKLENPDTKRTWQKYGYQMALLAGNQKLADRFYNRLFGAGDGLLDNNDIENVQPNLETLFNLADRLNKKEEELMKKPNERLNETEKEKELMKKLAEKEEEIAQLKILLNLSQAPIAPEPLFPNTPITTTTSQTSSSQSIKDKDDEIEIDNPKKKRKIFKDLFSAPPQSPIIEVIDDEIESLELLESLEPPQQKT